MRVAVAAQPVPGAAASPAGEQAPRLRRSFFWKLYLSYAALVLVSAFVIGSLVLGRLRQTALSDTEANLYGTARLLASMEAANPAHLWSDQLARQVREVAEETGLHLTLLYANGTPAAESTPSVAAVRPAEALALAEFRDARTRSYGRDLRVPHGTATEHLLLAVPILLELETIGFVRVGLPLTRLQERHVELRDRVLAGASLNALIALGLGFVFTRRVTRPLAAIGVHCQRLAAGRFDERIGMRRDDEIGVVAGTIDRMAHEVQQRIRSETRERQRLAALLAVMADGVVAVSARQTIAYHNDVAARLLGLDAAATGQPFLERVQLAGVRECYAEALREDRRVVRELRIAGHPQALVLRVDATPLRDPADAPFGVMLVLHDLSAIRGLEEMRRTFTANVSHELKTPLTAIGTLVDTLREDPAMPDAVRQRFLGKIRDQNERLHRLVQDLLMISRLEAERDVFEKSAIDLVGVLTECVQTFAEIADKKGVALTWDEEHSPVIVLGNAEALRLIFNNLLHNAVSYTAPGGGVVVGVTTADGVASVAVRDTGFGIEPRHLERIFERFYRVDDARARSGGGSGLGLSIVKHLTQALDGCVRVQSTPGIGSVFMVTLPLAHR